MQWFHILCKKYEIYSNNTYQWKPSKISEINRFNTSWYLWLLWLNTSIIWCFDLKNILKPLLLLLLPSFYASYVPFIRCSFHTLSFSNFCLHKPLINILTCPISQITSRSIYSATSSSCSVFGAIISAFTSVGSIFVWNCYQQ